MKSPEPIDSTVLIELGLPKHDKNARFDGSKYSGEIEE
jgi:hypothetical protein